MGRLTAPDVTLRDFLAAAAALRARRAVGVDGIRRPGQATPTLPGTTAPDPLVDAVVAAIEAAGREWATLTAEAVATRVGIAPRDLARALGRELGVSFRQCREAVVLRRAVRWLAETNEHVAQIAYRLGYEHPSHLDRQFRRLFGAAPTRLRGAMPASTVRTNVSRKVSMKRSSNRPCS